MARKNKLVKTNVQGIYTVETKDLDRHYVARFSYNGISYPQKNLTKLFNVRNLKEAKDKLNEIKYKLSQGLDIFSTINDNKVDSLIMEYFNKKSISYKRIGIATYSKHAKNVIGHLKINKVTKAHIETIIENMEQLNLSPSTIRKMRVYLNPIFKSAYESEVIHRNILNQVKFPSEQVKPTLSSRLDEHIIDAIRKIYQTVLNESDDYASMFLISIMCARRMGEILQIEYQDIKDKWVRVRAGTTKTYKDRHPDEFVESYPLPKEVLERIDFKDKKPNEKVFVHYHRTYLDKYKEMIDERCNLSLLPLAKEYPIRSHDNRNFIISILSKQYGVETVGSVALSHNTRKSDINQRYSDDIEDTFKQEIFNSYWKILRDKK